MADPVSVIGLVMSALTFPAQIFTSGVVAYTTISDMQHMGADMGTRFWLFKNQESRFIIWGQYHNACNPGGLDPTTLPAVLYSSIVQSLVQIQSLLENTEQLCSKYGLQRIGEVQPPGMTIIRRESFRQQNMVRRLQKSSSLLRRVKWAVRDQNRFDDLVKQLTELNNTLYEMLPIKCGQSVDVTVAAETLASSLIDRGAGYAQNLQQTTTSQLAILRGVDNAMNVASIREATETAVEVPATAPSQYLQLDVHRIDIRGEGFVHNYNPSLRSWALSRQHNPFSGPESLVVEWRRYDEQIVRGDLKAALQNRIQALAVILHGKPRTDSFRVLDCIGYFEDNSSPRFGLAFRLPPEYEHRRDPPPMTLFQAIKQYPKHIPYLGDRFQLAYMLAESVHALQAGGWLHKGINSHNILFFSRDAQHQETDTEKRPMALVNPYFTGFALCRPDDQNDNSSKNSSDVEMALYRHPDVQGLDGRPVAGYRALYDIYSLGTVLLEIGWWRSLASLLPRRGADAQDFRSLLLREYVPSLGAAMGERYMNAVRKCLEGSFERLAGFRETEVYSTDYKVNVRQGLLWEVVTILRDCRA